MLAQWGSYVQSKGIGCRPQRRTRRWGGALVSMLPLWFRANSVAFRCSRCGSARMPLRFGAPPCGFARIPASRGLFWGPLRLPAATAHAVAVGRGFVSTLPLWFRANSVAFRRSRCGFAANSVAFRCSRCGFAPFPATRGLFRPLRGGPLRLPAATAHTVGRGLRFDAPAVVSPLVASSSLFWGGPFRLPAATVHAVGHSVAYRRSLLSFRANSGLSWPLQASSNRAT